MYTSEDTHTHTHTQTGDRPVREVRDLSTGDSKVSLTLVFWSTVISQIHLRRRGSASIVLLIFMHICTYVAHYSSNVTAFAAYTMKHTQTHTHTHQSGDGGRLSDDKVLGEISNVRLTISQRNGLRDRVGQYFHHQLQRRVGVCDTILTTRERGREGGRGREKEGGERGGGGGGG